jgi:hypothetical protein
MTQKKAMNVGKAFLVTAPLLVSMASPEGFLDAVDRYL